jgi:hypothetical protein
MKKLITRSLLGIAALAVPLGASLALPMAAHATPAVSFSASKDGASAGWTNGNGSAIALTLGSTQASYAEITVHVPATNISATSEPTFSTNNYFSGSPRWVLTLSNHDTLWGYPPNANLSNGSVFAWAINNGGSYQNWSAIQKVEGGAKVTGAFVIADADQSANTTDLINSLTFNGTSFTS